MDTNARPVPVSARVPWKHVAFAAVLWLFGCSIAGVVVARMIGEHGSSVLAILGAAVGVAGAVSHALLLFAARFRALGVVKQALLVWVGTICLLLLSTLFTADGTGPSALAITQGIGVVLEYAALPALLAAFVFTRVLAHAA